MPDGELQDPVTVMSILLVGELVGIKKFLFYIGITLHLSVNFSLFTYHVKFAWKPCMHTVSKHVCMSFSNDYAN